MSSMYGDFCADGRAFGRHSLVEPVKLKVFDAGSYEGGFGGWVVACV